MCLVWSMSSHLIVIIKSPPTMWWRLIVLMLLIVVIIINIIIIILQQFDNVNALQSPIFIRSLRTFFLNTFWWIILLNFENQLICIFKIAAMGLFAYSRSTSDMNTLQSPIFIRSSQKKFLNTPWWIILLKFENQLICISKVAFMG